MLDRNNLVQLAKTVAKANSSAPTAYSYNGQNFSYDELNESTPDPVFSYSGHLL